MRCNAWGNSSLAGFGKRIYRVAFAGLNTGRPHVRHNASSVLLGGEKYSLREAGMLCKTGRMTGRMGESAFV
jgi:hypothetical protein